MWLRLLAETGTYRSDQLPPSTGTLIGGAGIAGGGMSLRGRLWQQAPSGAAPGSTGSDVIVALATVPASAFDVAGRTLDISAIGSCANNGNSKTMKIIVNPTSPEVGSAVSGGTTIASTGALSTNNAGWSLSASIVKTGGAGSNTQSVVQSAGQAGSAALALANPQSLTLTESAAITVAVTIDCATTASDAALWQFRGEWAN